MSMYKLTAYLLFFAVAVGVFFSTPLFTHAHGLATTKNQLIENYFVEFEYDTLGDVTAKQLTTYGFELLNPDNTEESIDFDRVFVKFAQPGGTAILSGNLYPMEGYGRKTARINATFEEDGTYEVEMTYYKDEKQLVESKFDFKVSPPDEQGEKNGNVPSYLSYLWIITLVGGFFAGTVIHVSIKKDEPKATKK